MKFKTFLKLCSPPLLLRGWRRLRQFWDWRLAPEIHYEAIPALPAAWSSDLPHNAHGAHLNESGDTRSDEQYLRSFEMEKELANRDVVDNLSFIEQVLHPLLPGPVSLLDVGCGIGRYGRFLRRTNAPTAHWRYAGVDRSEALVRFARQLCPECEFKSTEGQVSLPYPAESHDVVMASSMLQYTGDNWRAALGEMRRVARRYIFISRLPLLRRTPSTYCRQTVVEGRRRQVHYLVLLNRAEFEVSLAALSLRVVAKDYGTEWCWVDEIDEPVLLNLYVLAKENP